MQLREPKAFIAYKEDLPERFCILVLNCLLMFSFVKLLGSYLTTYGKIEVEVIYTD